MVFASAASQFLWSASLSRTRPSSHSCSLSSQLQAKEVQPPGAASQE